MPYDIYLFPLFSIILGYIVAIYFTPKNKKHIKLLLAFSGAFLLAQTVTHFLPEVYNYELKKHTGEHLHSKTGLFIMIGIIFQIFLEHFSKGAEHGHVHKDDQHNHLPFLLFFSLCLHALLEGLPVNNHHHLAYGIAIHHFPIAIILTTFFKKTHLNAKYIFAFMLVFAFMTPLGTLIANQLSFLQKYYIPISGIVIGILFHISSTIIFESNEGHKFNLSKLLAIIIGIVLASLT
jgi:zinc transporter ZupT